MAARLEVDHSTDSVAARVPDGFHATIWMPQHGVDTPEVEIGPVPAVDRRHLHQRRGQVFADAWLHLNPDSVMVNPWGQDGVGQ